MGKGKPVDTVELYRDAMRELEKLILARDTAPAHRLDAIRIYMEWHRPKPRTEAALTLLRPSREESAQALAEYIAQLQEDTSTREDGGAS